MDRLGPMLRQLVVGLVDQAINLRIVGSDPRLSGLQLGPVQVYVHPLPDWPFSRRRRRENIIEQLGTNPPTTIHALSSASYELALALQQAFDTDLTLHVTSALDCESLTRIESSRAARLIAVSRPLVQVLQSQLGIDPARVELIAPGIPVSKQPACFAEPTRAATLLCTAGLYAGAGVELVVEAADALRRSGHDFMLFLLGEGRREVPLRRLVRQRDLSSVVTFAHPLGDVATAMHSADIFVDPAAESAFRVDGLLAMAAGVAVVAFPSPVVDHYRDGETAVVCSQPTTESLIEQIGQLLSERKRARDMATRAIGYVKANHGVSRMAEQAAKLWRELALQRATFSIKE